MAAERSRARRGARYSRKFRRDSATIVAEIGGGLVQRKQLRAYVRFVQRGRVRSTPISAVCELREARGINFSRPHYGARVPVGTGFPACGFGGKCLFVMAMKKVHKACVDWVGLSAQEAGRLPIRQPPRRQRISRL